MNRFPVALIVLPGTGMRMVTVDEGTTVGQLFEAEQLSGRSAVVDGEAVDSSYTLRSGQEVAALKATKGA